MEIALLIDTSNSGDAQRQLALLAKGSKRWATKWPCGSMPGEFVLMNFRELVEPSPQASLAEDHYEARLA